MKVRIVALFAACLIGLSIFSWAAGSNAVFNGPIGLRSLGLLFASAGTVLVFLQFLFSSRLKIIESGFGLDRMFHWHRFFGRFGLGLLFLHFLFIALYRILVFGELLLNPFILVGILALAGLTVTAGLASTYKRLGIAYEIWRNIHLLNYFLFPFLLIHVFYHTVVGSLLYYLWLFLTLFFIILGGYRITRIVAIRKKPYEVVDLKQEADDIWSLYFSGEKIDFKPGQFMFIQLMRSGRISSPHPFTISNSPTREKLSITPKELGDFTLTIKDTRPGDLAFIDAPYGVFTFLHDADNLELVFIAGGIGITPFISMLRYMYDLGLERKVVLFWSVREEKNLCFLDELAEMQEKMPGFSYYPVLSTAADHSGMSGRLTGEMICNKLDGLQGKSFYICGLPGLTRAMIADLKSLGVHASMIKSELFQL